MIYLQDHAKNDCVINPNHVVQIADVSNQKTISIDLSGPGKSLDRYSDNHHSTIIMTNNERIFTGYAIDTLRKIITEKLVVLQGKHIDILKTLEASDKNLSQIESDTKIDFDIILLLINDLTGLQRPLVEKAALSGQGNVYSLSRAGIEVINSGSWISRQF